MLGPHLGCWRKAKRLQAVAAACWKERLRRRAAVQGGLASSRPLAEHHALRNTQADAMRCKPSNLHVNHTRTKAKVCIPFGRYRPSSSSAHSNKQPPAYTCVKCLNVRPTASCSCVGPGATITRLISVRVHCRLLDADLLARYTHACALSQRCILRFEVSCEGLRICHARCGGATVGTQPHFGTKCKESSKTDSRAERYIINGTAGELICLSCPTLQIISNHHEHHRKCNSLQSRN